MKQKMLSTAILLIFTTPGFAGAQPDKLLWGDTHLHTNLSPDAYVNRNTTVDPEAAYRFARGLPVIADDSKAKVRLYTPLDFLAVTDHAESNR